MPTRRPILVIDDDPSVVDILTRAASSISSDVKLVAIREFEEAAAYLEGLRGPGPQLILLDVNLSGELSGLDFLSRLRQHPQGCFVPVVILSDDENPARLQEAYLKGANAFTAKPERYQDWKTYLQTITKYWCEVVTKPRLWFENEIS